MWSNALSPLFSEENDVGIVYTGSVILLLYWGNRLTAAPYRLTDSHHQRRDWYYLFVFICLRTYSRETNSIHLL